MQKRIVLNSTRLSKLKKHRQRLILNKILVTFFGLLTICISLVFVSRLGSLNINNIEIVGNKVIDTKVITTNIQGELMGNYLWFFPKTNLLFYPENSIKSSLQLNFKRLKDINLSIKNGRTLEVSVSERAAKYMWCGVDAPADVGRPQSGRTTSAESCYFMDEDGYIFDQAPYFSGEVYFKFYGTPDVPVVSIPQGGSQTAGTNPSGLYFSQQNFKQLISFKDTLINLGLKPIAIYTTTEGDVHVILSQGSPNTARPEIILKLGADYENVAENLEAAITTDPLQTQFKNKYSSLKYIDLRFGNKVYYKFQ